MRSTPIHAAIVLALTLAGCAQTPTPRLTWTEAAADAGERVATFAANATDARIAGEIHALPGADARTAVIIVGGSGMRTRADAAPGIPLFMDSDVAVAIYDRRGNGESTGQFEVPDTENSAWLVPAFARDVTAVAGLLKKNGFERVGLLGTSMGGWVNVATAASSGDIDFIICISGGASTVGVSDAFDLYTDEGRSIEEAIAAARLYDGPSGYDPSADLKALAQPALWVFGDRDDSNPTALDAEAVARLQADGKDFTLMILPGVNHDLVNVETGEFDMNWVAAAQAFIAGKTGTP